MAVSLHLPMVVTAPIMGVPVIGVVAVAVFLHLPMVMTAPIMGVP